MFRTIADHFLLTGIMAGAIIGAGIFSLPYIFMGIGIFNGLLLLIAMAIMATFINFLYADVVIKTKGNHNFVGLARIYLGKLGVFWAVIMAVAQGLLILVIYLILSQSFLALVLEQASTFSLVVFWAVASLFIFVSLRRLAAAELLIILGTMAIVLIVFFQSLPFLLHLPLVGAVPSVSSLFFALGPILFALGGRAAVVEMIRYAKKHISFGKRRDTIKHSLILGMAGPVLVYFIFVLAIGSLAPTVTKDAVSGLIEHLPSISLLLIGILGLLSILSSYIIVGFDINDILKYDLYWPKAMRILAMLFVPIGFYLYGFQNFIDLVAFTGGIVVIFSYLFIMYMWWQARRINYQNSLIKRMPIWALVVITLFVLAVFVSQIYVRFF